MGFDNFTNPLKKVARKAGTSKVLALLIMLIIVCSLSIFQYSCAQGKQKRILIVYSYNHNLPVDKLFTKGLKEQMGQILKDDIEYEYEYLELS
ncbi:MAG: hypothetical protein ACM3KR_10100, partial [Deltaproteobacteria bacterium]